MAPPTVSRITRRGEIPAVIRGGIQKGTGSASKAISKIRMRKKYSSFFMTLNTQQAPSSDAEKTAWKERLNAVVREYLDEVVAKGFALRIASNDRLADQVALEDPAGGHSLFNSENVLSIKVNYSVEIGSPTGRYGGGEGKIHAHIQIDFTHLFDDLKLNFKVIREYFGSKLNLKNIYLDVRVRMNPAERPKDYIEKNLDEIEEVHITNREGRTVEEIENDFSSE